MSTETTRRMIKVYNQNGSQPIRFLSGFFQSPSQNFHTSEEVEIDIVRSDEDIAVVIQDLTTGYRMNSEDIYTNKAFKPPIFKEAVALNSFDLIKRMPGQNPFQSPDYRANVIFKMFSAMQLVERKIRRSIEVQASQVFQTGIVTLTDSNGVALYTLDYKPKASHFPTSAVAWGLPTATIEADISSLSEVIRNDGLEDPNQLIMGVNTFEAFIKDTEIQKRYDNRRIDLGTIAPLCRCAEMVARIAVLLRSGIIVMIFGLMAGVIKIRKRVQKFNTFHQVAVLCAPVAVDWMLLLEQFQTSEKKLVALVFYPNCLVE